MSNFEKIAQPGTKISLQFVQPGTQEGEEDIVKTYETKVCDIKKNGQIEVYMPMDQTKLILLQVGTAYDLFTYTKGGIYECRVRVADRYKNDNVYLLLLNQLTPLEKKQQREYFRFSCLVPMYDRLLSGSEERMLIEGDPLMAVGALPDETTEQKSIIIDISGGGLRFVSAGKYESGDMIRVRVFLHREMTLYAKVIASVPRENAKDRFEQRAKFVNITRGERDEIVRYIFEQERITRKNVKED